MFVNVGGVYFLTRKSTLDQSSSFFSKLLLTHPNASELFVDRDPAYFRYILNWMRGVRYLPEDDSVLQELLWESDYYCINDMRDTIQRMKNRFNYFRTLQNVGLELKQLVHAQQSLAHSIKYASSQRSTSPRTVTNSPALPSSSSGEWGSRS